MVEMNALTPLNGLAPVATATCRLDELPFVELASVMPFSGKLDDCSKALKKLTKLALPAVGKTKGNAKARILWSERNQWFVEGVDAETLATELKGLAAVTDQSDGWARFSITGTGAEAVMARLCPLDLSDQAFAKDHAARTEFAHMMSVITRTADGFSIMVMRSFARTAVHHSADVMRSVAAQSEL